jgi:hypothetical protein
VYPDCFVSAYDDGPSLVFAYPKPVTASKCERESVTAVLRTSLGIGRDFKNTSVEKFMLPLDHVVDEVVRVGGAVCLPNAALTALVLVSYCGFHSIRLTLREPRGNGR